MQTKARDYLLPTTLEAVLYGVIAVLIVLVANFGYLVASLLYQNNDIAQAANNLVGLYFNHFVRFFEGLSFVPSGAVFIFWSFAGIFIFSLLQSVYSVYATLKGDIDVANHFMHPRNYTNWRFWEEVFLQFIAHISLYALIGLWSVMVIYALIPFSNFFTRQFFTQTNFHNFLSFISSFALLYIGVMLLAIILKLFSKRKQLLI